jgi:hypothetical protein
MPSTKPSEETLRKMLEIQWRDHFQTRLQTWKALEITSVLAVALVGFDWQAASGPGANDGYLDFWLNEVQQGHLTGIDNDTWQVDHVRLGAIGVISANTSGTIYFDGFESRRLTYIGPDLSGPVTTT